MPSVPRIVMDTPSSGFEGDVFLALGTMLTVYPVAYLPQRALESGARLVIARLMTQRNLQRPLARHAYVDVDNFLSRTMSDQNDQRATQIAMKAKAVRRAFETGFVTGDAATVVGEYREAMRSDTVRAASRRRSSRSCKAPGRPGSRGAVRRSRTGCRRTAS